MPCASCSIPLPLRRLQVRQQLKERLFARLAAGALQRSSARHSSSGSSALWATMKLE